MKIKTTKKGESEKKIGQNNFKFVSKSCLLQDFFFHQEFILKGMRKSIHLPNFVLYIVSLIFTVLWLSRIGVLVFCGHRTCPIEIKWLAQNHTVYKGLELKTRTQSWFSTFFSLWLTVQIIHEYILVKILKHYRRI